MVIVLTPVPDDVDRLVRRDGRYRLSTVRLGVVAPVRAVGEHVGVEVIDTMRTWRNWVSPTAVYLIVGRSVEGHVHRVQDAGGLL